MKRYDTRITTVLSIGPIGFPLTGQACATETWFHNSKHKVVPINNNFEGMSNVARFLRSLALPFLVLLETRRSHPEALYLSLKRSILGATADLACVLVYRRLVAGPVVVHLHGADLATIRRNWLGNVIIRQIWNNVTDVILLSPAMSNQLTGLPEKRVSVVYNFSSEFSGAAAVEAKAERLLTEPLRVLYLSNIMFSKGFSYLIDAVHSVRAAGLPVTLTLAGHPLGDAIMTAEQARARLMEGLAEGITYVGTVHGSDKWAALDAAHIIALPTFYSIEAQPISLIEGMAFGCIPLTTRHNFNEDFLDPNATVFVEPKSSKSIAEALKAMVSDRGGMAARTRSAFAAGNNRHSLENFVNGIDAVVEAALDKAPLRDQSTWKGDQH